MQKGTLKYIEIAQQIKEFIMKNADTGDNILSERMLAQHFSVTRGTIRRAIGLLRNQGLINTKIGAGNFVVRNSNSLNLSNVSSLEEFTKETNGNVRAEIINFERNVKLPDSSNYTDLFKDNLAHSYVRLVYIDEKICWYEIFYLSAGIFPDFTEQDTANILKYVEETLHLKIGKYYRAIEVDSVSSLLYTRLNTKDNENKP